MAHELAFPPQLGHVCAMSWLVMNVIMIFMSRYV